jgi:16S rRNA processing protein RimM
MGRVQGPYGVNGWLKVRGFTSSPDSLIDYDRWWLTRSDGEWHECKVVSARMHSENVLVEIAGVGTREAAATWRGSLVGIPRAALRKLGPGEFYWFDLVGFSVVNRAGKELGVVSGLLENAAHAILKVVGKGGRERLIPVVASYLDAIDAANKRITVDWLEDY